MIKNYAQVLSLIDSHLYRLKLIKISKTSLTSVFISSLSIQHRQLIKMNSKILQDKIQEIESHEIEMRLLRKNESKPDMNSGDDKEKAGLQSNQPTVSLKHYDQVN